MKVASLLRLSKKANEVMAMTNKKHINIKVSFQKPRKQLYYKMAVKYLFGLKIKPNGMVN